MYPLKYLICLNIIRIYNHGYIRKNKNIFYLKSAKFYVHVTHKNSLTNASLLVTLIKLNSILKRREKIL